MWRDGQLFPKSSGLWTMRKKDPEECVQKKKKGSILLPQTSYILFLTFLSHILSTLLKLKEKQNHWVGTWHSLSWFHGFMVAVTAKVTNRNSACMYNTPKTVHNITNATWTEKLYWTFLEHKIHKIKGTDM